MAIKLRTHSPPPGRTRASLVGAAVGGLLGLAGVAEARRLANGDDATLPRSARTTGPIRAVAGAALMTQPRPLPLAVGAGSSARAPEWLIGMVAVREIVLGIGLFRAARPRHDPRPWLLSAAATDGAECIVVLDAIAPATARCSGAALVVAAVIACLRRPEWPPVLAGVSAASLLGVLIALWASAAGVGIDAALLAPAFRAGARSRTAGHR